jgi:hypothetical protein
MANVQGFSFHWQQMDGVVGRRYLHGVARPLPAGQLDPLLDWGVVAVTEI